jgi:hypothetical protein
MCGRVVQASEPLRYAFVDGLSLPDRTRPPSYNVAPSQDAIPAEMQTNGLAPVEPASLTVEIEGFCSRSAYRMKMRSMARASTGFDLTQLTLGVDRDSEDTASASTPYAKSPTSSRAGL